MRLFDIHTHNVDSDPQSSIYSSKVYIDERRISIGIHPWTIDTCWKELFSTIKEEASKVNVCAIGECGIDKLKSPVTTELQQEVFKAHAQLAEELKKPLIIHCVKGFDEIIALHKDITPGQAWIIHGFRGKPQQAEQLIKNGFHISFGEKFNSDSLKTTPMEKLFVESDESNIGIDKIYHRIAEARGCTTEELALSVISNAEKCDLIL